MTINPFAIDSTFMKVGRCQFYHTGGPDHNFGAVNPRHTTRNQLRRPCCRHAFGVEMVVRVD